MPKQLRLTAKEVENLLLKAGFVLLCGKGSHHISLKDNQGIFLPFHAGKILHPIVPNKF